MAGKPNVCTLYTITKKWDESEVTWNNADKGTKWEMLDPDTRFYNPDLKDTVSSPGGVDYNPQYVAIGDYVTMNSWEEYTVTTPVKEAIKNPQLFHGFMLKQFLDRRVYEKDTSENRSNQGKAYNSSENDSLDKRPKLTVKYTLTGIKTHTQSTLIHPIQFLRKGDKITFFIPAGQPYSMSVFSLQGEKLISLTGCNTNRIDLPLNSLPSGVNIVIIKIGQQNISTRFSFIK